MTAPAQRVRLSKQGRKAWPDSPYNPYNRRGVCTHVSTTLRFCYSVVWSNGLENTYRAGELNFITEEEPE